MNSKPKRLLKLLLCLSAGLVGLLILVNCYLGVNKAVTHNPVPSLCGVAPLVVLSGSMEPAIYPGDVVIIRAQPAEEYEAGDIATYLSGGTPYTHRIVRVENGRFVMKGDSNNTEDDTVASDKLLGKVIFIIPKLGLAIVFAKKPAGMAVLAVILLLFAYSGPLIGRLRGKRDETEGGKD